MSEKHLPITGGCTCGAIRYESAQPPVNGGFCHCTQCQREGGGFFTVQIMVPRLAFRFIRGEPTKYARTPALNHLFCAICGSTLAGEYVGGEHMVLNIGSLDHPGNWPLDQEGWFGHAFVANKVPWEVIGDDLPQHHQEPPGDTVIFGAHKRADQQDT